MPCKNFPPHELQPRKLSQEEISNPYLVIQDLFDFDHLPGIRELLWEWLKVTVTGSWPRHLTRSERAELLIFYEYMEKLVEAVHIIKERTK